MILPFVDGGAVERGDASARYRIIVRSLGEASFALRPVLSRALAIGDEVLARLLLQAPSELRGDLDGAEAAGLLEALAPTGLDAAAIPVDAPFEPGRGDFEVALAVRDVRRVPEVAAFAASFLGTDLASALKLIFGAPPVLVSRVSAATVAVLRRRFAPLGVEVFASATATARFDLYGAAGAGTGDRRALDVLARLEVPIARGAPVTVGRWRRLAEDLGAEVALASWRELRRYDLPVRILDRAFQRFDVRLDAAGPNGTTGTAPTVERLLVGEAGVPESAVARILARLPVVVMHDVSRERCAAIRAALVAAGARVTALPVDLQELVIVLTAAPDVDRAARTLSGLIGVPEAEARRALERLPLRVDGPFGPLQARWLRGALGDAGITAHMVPVEPPGCPAADGGAP